jgi:hypothetical protein
VSVQELSELLRLHGWYLDLRERSQTRDAYAKRRIGKQVLTRYLKTEAKLEEVTPEFVLERINRSESLAALEQLTPDQETAS